MGFAGVFDGKHRGPFESLDGYKFAGESGNIAYKVSAEMPGDDLNEQWRQTYVDMTSFKGEFGSASMVKGLGEWLVKHLPISLAMNTTGGDLSWARSLFEQTGQVVYTVGREGAPALTCQARPQEGEIFGEFPVRKELKNYTKYPVLVPSPTAAYNCHYTPEHLAAAAGRAVPAELSYTAGLVGNLSSPAVKGFCVLLMEYLVDAVGVNQGDGKGTGGPDRTILFGMQRPPLNGQKSLLRCGAETTLEELAPTLVPFWCTNAFDSVTVSCDPTNKTLQEQLQAHSINFELQSDAQFDKSSSDAYNVVTPDALADNNNTGALEKFPMVGQFMTLYMPVGHIKSTTVNDGEFVDFFSASDKWLQLRR